MVSSICGTDPLARCQDIPCKRAVVWTPFLRFLIDEINTIPAWIESIVKVDTKKAVYLLC